MPQTKVPKASKLTGLKEVTLGEEDQKTSNKIIDFDDVENFEELGFQKGTTKENILFKCNWSPFEGQQFPASIRYTLVNGEVAYEEGKINTEAYTKAKQNLKEDLNKVCL